MASPEIERALESDRVVDIVTVGARTGLPRTVEIWFSRVDGRIILCGTPGAGETGGSRRKLRGWLANLRANPNFLFCFKESIRLKVPATAREITNDEDRRKIMSAPSTAWYRDHVDDFEDLVKYSPIVEVFLHPSRLALLR